MDSLRTIVARSSAFLSTRDTDADSSSFSSPLIKNLLIALLALLLIAVIVGVLLIIVRRARKARAAKETLPTYNDASRNTSRLTITTPAYNGRNSSIYVYDEKSSMISHPSSPGSPSSVPEIRITFPDEEDEAGRQQRGRVVVVRVGENGIGLEPLRDEQLPAYEKEAGGRFHSIDMERIGGLKEKSEWA